MKIKKKERSKVLCIFLCVFAPLREIPTPAGRDGGGCKG